MFTSIVTNMYKKNASYSGAFSLSYFSVNKSIVPISNDTVVRISDHSTYLQTWVDNGTSSKPNLFSIVIEVNPSKPNPNINSDTLFKVIEYKHRLRSPLNGEEYLELINAIKGAIGNGGQFSNPFGVKKKLLYA